MKGEKKYSIITDHLGTPSQMYNEEGKLFWQGSLDSYGRMRMERGETGSCPFRYQGQYEDKEIGLYYNRFRYYSPEEGMYISQDPIGLLSGEFGFYNYVKDTNGWVDIFGLAPTYTQRSRSHVYTHGHAANSTLPKGSGKSKFRVSEGGNSFMNEVVNHPSVVITHQSNGRIKYEVSDLGRKTGYDTIGGDVRGGTVIVEGPTPSSWSIYSTDEVVTMFPT